MRCRFIQVTLLTIILAGCASQQKLMTSVTEMEVGQVKSLVDQGMNPYRPDVDGESAVSLGLKAPEDSEIYSWAESLAKDSSEDAESLYFKVATGEFSIPSFRAELAKYSFYIDAPIGKNEHSLLMGLVASEVDHGYIETALEFHANPNYGSETGFSPVTYALTIPDLSMFQLFVDRGADINAKDSQGWTPLMRAAYEGNVNGVRGLIDAGAYLNVSDRDGWQAIHMTVNSIEYGDRSNDREIAELLVEAGSSYNGRLNSSGATPIQLSVVNDRDDVFTTLLAYGVDLEIPGENGFTPLISAAYKGNLNAVNALIESGADLEAKSDHGWTALHVTASPMDDGDRSNDHEIARSLLINGANPDSVNGEQTTPIMLASMNDRRDIVDLLIGFEARLDLENIYGRTALEEALRNENWQISPVLTDHGSPWPNSM